MLQHMFKIVLQLFYLRCIFFNGNFAVKKSLSLQQELLEEGCKLSNKVTTEAVSEEKKIKNSVS